LCHLILLIHEINLFINIFPAVIRAKVVGKKEVDSGNDIYGNPIKRIQYEIKQIKVRDEDGICLSHVTYNENALH